MGRASANGLKGLAIAAVAALLIAVFVGAADGKKKPGGGGKLSVLTSQPGTLFVGGPVASTA
jgi:hypothetical protein